MQAAANVTRSRSSKEENRVRALIRFNAALFHAIAAASFLEAAAHADAGRLLLTATDADLSGWIEGVWRRERSARARELRAYIEAVWPEFDWIGAFEGFNQDRAERPPRAVGRTTPALQCLERCALEAQAAVFYRAIRNCADDPALRELAHSAAADHFRCFGFFRSRFAVHCRQRPVRFLAGFRAVCATARAARDGDVATAFQALAGHWYGTPTVAQLGYQEFLQRMTRLVSRHAGLGLPERLLLSPWRRRAAPLVATTARTRAAAAPGAWAALKAAA